MTKVVCTLLLNIKNIVIFLRSIRMVEDCLLCCWSYLLTDILTNDHSNFNCIPHNFRKASWTNCIFRNGIFNIACRIILQCEVNRSIRFNAINYNFIHILTLITQVRNRIKSRLAIIQQRTGDNDIFVTLWSQQW